MKIYAALTALCLTAPTALADDISWAGRGLTLSHGEQQLEGTLLDTGKAGAPLVILHAGSGPTDRDGNQANMQNNSLKYIAEGLAAAGIDTFRFDKRGIGASASAGSEADLRIQTYADDLIAVTRHFQQNAPNKPIFLLGHSEGALMAMLAASELEVDGVISIAGAGRDAATIILEQLSDRAGVDIVAEAREIIETLTSGGSVETVSPPLMGLFRPSVQPYVASWLAVDPAKVAAQLDERILVVQGTTDIQVSVVDACQLADVGDHVRVVLIVGMNHVLKTIGGGLAEQMPSYQDPDLMLHDELVPSLIDFIAEDQVGTPTCPENALAHLSEPQACFDDENYVGDWSGVIEGIGLRLNFHLQQGEAGCLTGTWDSPDQGANGLPLSSVEATESGVLIKADAFGIAFEGRLGDGKLDGTFRQGGASFALILEPM